MIASLRFLGVSLLILSIGEIFNTLLVILIGTLAVAAFGSLVSLHAIFYFLKRKKLVGERPQTQPRGRCCGS